MKLKFMLFMILLIACRNPEDSFFEAPSYIDINYLKYRPYTIFERSYKNKLKKLLLKNGHFSKSINDNDNDYRENSRQYEPKQYFRYIEATEKFNSEDYKSALNIFNEIQEVNSSNKSSDSSSRDAYSWVMEASLYMIARCKLVISQNNWDGYSDPKSIIDQNILDDAKESYQEYIDKYPNGIYVNSVRNIFRKIWYLAGDSNRLYQEYKNIMLDIFPNKGDKNRYYIGDESILSEFNNYFKGNMDIT
ncbi:MAG: hypothetical protein EOP34_08085, partial [Rickettsiales bacterium]